MIFTLNGGKLHIERRPGQNVAHLCMYDGEDSVTVTATRAQLGEIQSWIEYLRENLSMAFVEDAK